MLYEDHLMRLKTSAKYFGFFIDETAIREAMQDLEREFVQSEHYRARILLNRLGTHQSSFEKITPPKDQRKERVKICWASSNTTSRDRFLFHKTTCRDLYDHERKRALSEGYFDVIFCNERGEVTESSIANIFVRKNGELLTSPIECGLLPGTMRQEILRRSSRSTEKVLFPKDLRTADGIYLTNSVRGIIPVELLE